MYRSTKIIGTLGPSSNTESVILSLVKAGVNTFRLNFGHGSHQSHSKLIKIIRKIEEQRLMHIGIIADLQGPKFRVGNLLNPLKVFEGDQINFIFSEKQLENFDIPIPHKEIFLNVLPNEIILINDGKLKFKVNKVSDSKINASIINSGIIESNKGINIPNSKNLITSITKKDQNDLDFAIKNNLDFVALSFVQSVKDILELRSLIDNETKIIAKIEKPSAVKEIDNIIQVSDVMMIARGDLGVEMSSNQIPVIQKQIILKSRKYGKPIIVATQMLETMIINPQPTRAEASDVAGAVFEGVDTIMLSGETAVGKFPLETVKMMSSIALSAEKHIKSFPEEGPSKLDVEDSIYHAVANAAVVLANKINAKLIISYTTSGNTALRIARERPEMPILVVSPSYFVLRQSSLLWGAITLFQNEKKFDDSFKEVINYCKTQNLVSSGDSIVVVSGVPFGVSGSTNAVRVFQI